MSTACAAAFVGAVLTFVIAVGTRPAAAVGQTCPVPAGATVDPVKARVAPSEMVEIRGAGWAPSSTVEIEVNSAQNFANFVPVRTDPSGKFVMQFKADRAGPSLMHFSAACGTDGRVAEVRVVASGSASADPTPARSTEAPDSGFPWWILLVALAIVAGGAWAERRRRRRAAGSPSQARRSTT